jgi:hypothetical protein
MRAASSGWMTVTLVTLGVILAIVAEITLLQAQSTSLARIQVSTTTSTLAIHTTSGLHNVTFVDLGQCGVGAEGWAISKWGVTFDNTTRTDPPDANFSQIQSRDFALYLLPNESSSITFAVPDGSYSYQLYPNASQDQQGPLEVLTGPPSEYRAHGATGVITVSGTNLEFCLGYPAVVA